MPCSPLSTRSTLASRAVGSCRTFAAQVDGFIGAVPHYNSIFNYLESETLTPIVYRLIEESSAPLAAVEKDFAVDSTGFGTVRRFMCDSRGADP